MPSAACHALRKSTRFHQGEVDQIPTVDGIIAPAVRIGQQHAGGHVQRRQGRNAAEAIGVGRRLFQIHAGFEHDLELDLHAVFFQHGANAILIDPHIARGDQR